MSRLLQGLSIVKTSTLRPGGQTATRLASLRVVVGTNDLVGGLAQLRKRVAGLIKRRSHTEPGHACAEPFPEICRSRAADGIDGGLRRQHGTHRLDAGGPDHRAWKNLQTVGTGLQRGKTF